MDKAKKILMPIAFLLILVLIVMVIEPVFRIGEPRLNQIVEAFYSEEDNALDVVYVGSSNAYASWQAPLAWENHGIAACTYSVPSMPANALPYVIEECRKTQPDALYIVNLNMFKDEAFSPAQLHYTVDNMPFSSTKVKLISELAPELDCYGLDQLEYYFPMIRFHSRWSTLDKSDFVNPYNGLKGGSKYGIFLSWCQDVTNMWGKTEDRVPLGQSQLDQMTALLDYCEKENVKLLLVKVPQAIESTGTLAELNSLYDLAVERGFDVLDFPDGIEELDLDLTTDFYNSNHFNIHGSVKYTNYVAGYIVEKYGLEDHRGDPAYASWEEASAAYHKEICNYTTDFERACALRDYTLNAITGITTTVYGQEITVKWPAVENADGYAVYRRVKDEENAWCGWEKLAEVDGKTLSYTDSELPIHTNYGYTVIAFRNDGEAKLYGKINYEGSAKVTGLNAPALTSLEETPEGVLFTWEPVEGASGYAVYRGIPGQDWKVIATVTDGASYTDTDYDTALPYVYSIRTLSTDGETTYNGALEKFGLLLKKDISAPVVRVKTAENGQLTLDWNPVEGASHYYVYKQTEDDQWKRVSRMAYSKDSKYTADAAAGTYKVCAVIEHAGAVYEYPAELIKIEGGAK